jgi:hypothetical protein
MRRENVRLYREGKWTRDGRMLLDTTHRIEPLPLLVAGPDGSGDGALLMGSVIDIHRGKRGWMLGTLISFAADGVDPDFRGLCCQAEFDQAEIYRRRRRLFGWGAVMPGARLCAVLVGDKPCWKGMEIR